MNLVTLKTYFINTIIFCIFAPPEQKLCIKKTISFLCINTAAVVHIFNFDPITQNIYFHPQLSP